MNTTEIGIGGNREHKDTLFRKIFGTEEHKKYLLSLYNALNDSSYDSVDDLELITLDDVLFVSMKNDVAFLVDCEMHLYEHQSTLNPNMPLRGFLYTAKLWQNWIAKNKKNIYRSTLIKIPTPHYVVFYNGTEELEDKSELRLSDAFEKPQKEGKYEWTADVYNINIGKNKRLMEQCRALYEYADFVQMVRNYSRVYKDTKEAIKNALQEAIDKNYLDGYFKREREEVFMTTLFEVDKEIYENDLRKEGEIKGRKEGRKEIMFAMYQSGISINQIAAIIKMDIEEVEKMIGNK